MLGEVLKELRKQCSFTQQQIGDLLAIDRSTYAYYESNKTQPNFEILKKIARIYNVSIDYLLDFQVDSFTPLTVNDDTDDGFNDFNVPFYTSELTKDEKQIVLFYRTVEDKKSFREYIENKYYEEIEKENKNK